MTLTNTTTTRRYYTSRAPDIDRWCAYCWAQFTPKTEASSFCSPEHSKAYGAHDARLLSADIRGGIVRPGGLGDNQRFWSAWLDA